MTGLPGADVGHFPAFTVDVKAWHDKGDIGDANRFRSSVKSEHEKRSSGATA
jgi:hypothetical protein